MVAVYVRLVHWGYDVNSIPALWRYDVKKKLGIRDADVIEHEKKLAEKEAEKKKEQEVEDSQSVNAKIKP